MHIQRIFIDGFKRLTNFELELNPSLTVLVGDNETGKTSVLQALALVLSRQYDGRNVDYSLDPYLFNSTAVADYFATVRKGKNAPPPQVLIEAYFEHDSADPALGRLRGTNNMKSEDCPGLSLSIEVDSTHVEALKEYARDDSNPVVLPVEFYKVTWRSFSNQGIAARELPFRGTMIDTHLPRVHRGPQKYVAQVVNDVLTDEQRRNLSLAYKKLRHGFAQEPGVTAINKDLAARGTAATKKTLTVQVDMSLRSNWESAVIPHLDDLPFDCAGNGEQCRIQILLAILGAEPSRVLLIEEPENHLSHSNLNILMDDIRNHAADRQVVVATHSAFVLNKLGIGNLRLISRHGRIADVRKLTDDTRNYFMKLPGYDTLRLILSKRAILVEGPSDELIVQRAFKDKHQKLPLEDGVDVISVGSLAFKRFLEIAALLKLDVRVVTDNDGDVTAVKDKYADYLHGAQPTITILYDDDEQYPTLEPQLLKANSRNTLNAIFGTKHADDAELLKYMERNKTDCALRMFQAAQPWTAPGYIAAAIEQ